MKARSPSLAQRLLTGAAVSTAIALFLVIALIHHVLTLFITGQIDQRLDDKIISLASQVRVDAGGLLAVVGNADGPPYDKKVHHSFWIVSGPSNALHTAWLTAAEEAQVLQDVELSARLAGDLEPVQPPRGFGQHPRSLDGLVLGSVRLHVRLEHVRLRDDSEALILAAAPAEAITRPIGDAMIPVIFATGGLGVALAVFALFQVSLGLRPLRRLCSEVVAITQGRRERLSTEQPGELLPLVEELNRLLALHAANLEIARRHVANLAHGLRTPLATLQLGVERLDRGGSNEMRLLLAQIDLRIRHHLGRARAGVLTGPEGLRTQLASSLNEIGEALRRIYADRSLTFELTCAETVVLACERNDVDEIFGNLLDNAFKHARGHVGCRVDVDGDVASVEIRDDGPGLTPAQIHLVMEPGRRLDETIPGFGFGLPIARELVELYGGELQARSSAGLVVVVRLPRRR